jgi:1-acyl-sn-glycerol-3-phosphate acyltransferase
MNDHFTAVYWRRFSLIGVMMLGEGLFLYIFGGIECLTDDGAKHTIMLSVYLQERLVKMPFLKTQVRGKSAGGHAVTITERILNSFVNGILRLACRVDVSELDRVPENGPLIIVTNHVSFLEVPLIFTHLRPRPLTGFAKAETWDNPLLGWMFNVWRAIPLKRGEADIAAMRSALDALREGRILALAPEGTRSGHGRLQRAKPGVALLALRSGAPLLPIVHIGGEDFKRNLTRFWRTDFRVIVGNPFQIEIGGHRVTAEIRQQIADEIMYQIAAMLPKKYRGVYADLSATTAKYLRFSDPSQSNLQKAG